MEEKRNANVLCGIHRKPVGTGLLCISSKALTQHETNQMTLANATCVFYKRGAWQRLQS